MKKLYELEMTRNNVTPRAFYGMVRRELLKKGGVELESWVGTDGYWEWANPSTVCDAYSTENETICKKPFDFQIAYNGAYNVIMEFQFDDDNRGTGYAYICEYEAEEQPAPETEPAAPQEAANDETETEETEMTVMEKIEAIVSKYGVGMSHKTLASKVYRELTADGTEAIILNDRYIMAGGVEYRFVKRAGAWTVKAVGQAAAPETETAEAAQAPEAAADNKDAAMTAQEITARELFARAHELRNRAEGLNYEGKLDDGFVRSIERLEVAAYRAAAHESAMRTAAMERLRAKQAATDGGEAKDSAEAGQHAPQEAELTAFEQEGMRNGCFPMDKDAGTAACKAYREALAARGIDTALTHFGGNLFAVKGVDEDGNLFDLPANACA